MNLNQGLKLLQFLCLSLVTAWWPAGLVHASTNLDDYPLVQVEIRQDVLAPYKERRSRHGFQFDVSYEPIEFKQYRSFIDGFTYTDMFGETTTNLISLSAEYKFNFALGGISLGALYGMGQVTGPSDRSLDLTKYGAKLKYTMDNVFSEPYVAPYVAVDLLQMSYNEKFGTDSFSGTTQMSYSYSLGLLLQLNWIDKDTARNATYEYGLENTYIDVYMTKYNESQAEDDPNLSSDFSFGAGLVFEF